MKRDRVSYVIQNFIMQLQDALQHLGLSEKEANVYLALLELGTSTAPAIAKKSGEKRPTVYVLLDELRKKELVTVMPKRSKMLYSAHSPKLLMEERQEQSEEISRAMPEILALYSGSESKPKVRYYEGIKEILNLYNKEIFQAKEVWFIASIGSIPKPVLINIERQIPRIRRGEILLREIGEDDPVSRAFAKKHACKYYHIKRAPKGMRLPTDNAIFGNKIAIFSYKNKHTPMAVMIESEDVVKTYRTLFELVWNGISEDGNPISSRVHKNLGESL